MISILFGAGASYGSEIDKPTPPLGNCLFDKLVDAGGAFNDLSDTLKANFRSQGFEKGMLDVPNDSRIINPLQKEIAIYLSSFSSSMENAYVKLFKSLGSDASGFNLITLNYDLLIEESLFLLGVQKINYGINKCDGEYYLLKLHGSSNFIPDFGNFHIKGIIGINSGSFLETENVKALSTHQEIKTWCEEDRDNDFSPVMCMYNKDKRAVINASYLEKMKSEYLKTISATRLLIIIGVKYIEHDHHVWDVIFENDVALIIVDPQPSEAFLLLLEKRSAKYEVIKKSFHLSIDDIVDMTSRMSKA